VAPDIHVTTSWKSKGGFLEESEQGFNKNSILIIFLVGYKKRFTFNILSICPSSKPKAKQEDI
jgi:hypothetical protein